jgi:thiamine kinase
MKLAEHAGLAPPIMAADPSSGALLTPFVTGRSFPAVGPVSREKSLEAVGRGIASLHALRGFRGILDPRAAFDVYAADVGRRDDYPLLDGFDLERVRLQVDEAMRRTSPRALVASHGDPTPANLLLVSPVAGHSEPAPPSEPPVRVLFLDWEFSALADPRWDLAYFAAEAALRPGERSLLLSAYHRAGGARVFEDELQPWIEIVDLVSGLWLLTLPRPDVDGAQSRIGRGGRPFEE